ncbi:DUF2357 domain-containing protein [Rubrivirga litoralis]|uniref:DUF2357 domain-containing protein n=1 Tax=Rubrivirga litoralis TaxID=3075598 RepID=A0ABU3BU75_9BACT|nr:DUF2357 domain-containing protein [Rubrivirga sp. F394]MDT0632844.1 DUF2357 domain-containing protein [Rubrivirga sp. F394]
MQTLFTIETAALRLTWSGPPRPARGSASDAGRPAPLVARALGAGLRLDAGGAAASDERDVVLEEETSYAVLVQSLSGEPVSLEHRDPVVVGGLVAADGGRVVHGRVRFGSQAGRARFVVRAGGRPEVELEVTVAPTKLPLSDVEAMRADVEAAAAGLSVASLRPATLAGGAREGRPAPPVWLAALAASVGALEDAVAEIDRRPALETVRPARAVRADRLRRASPETRSAARRGGMAGVLPGRPARLTDDTAAHRWIGAALDRLVSRLGALAADEVRRRPTARRESVRREIAGLEARLRRVRARPVLGGAGRAPAVPPLVLRRRPAYAAAYDALRAAERGLDLQSGGLDVATQDLAVLYETWAALVVVRTAAAVLGLSAPPRLAVDVEGADVRLRPDQAVGLAGGAAAVEVRYQPRFPAPPALLVQRPDLWLTVRQAGRNPADRNRAGRPTRRVVLDAKYRRDDAAGYRRRHGAAGPPEDALGTLHRYRDAIVGPGGEAGVVDLAAALFPGDDDPAFRTSRLWTSLDALGVGAVPLRPGHEGALRALLTRLIEP